MKIHLYTIGFTKKSAEQFFSLLLKNEVKQLVDVRLNNSSQLAGFAKGSDLQYFARAIGNMNYAYIEDFAPSKELLDDYKSNRIDWDAYQRIYYNLLKERNILEKYCINDFDFSCFLCSEDQPNYCHRSLLVEFLKANNKDKDVRIVHLI